MNQTNHIDQINQSCESRLSRTSRECRSVILMFPRILFAGMLYRACHV